MPETNDPNAEIERISERIKVLADEHFGRGEPKFYLSGLGSLLGDDRGTLEKLSKRKLADFVENVLHFDIGRSGQHLNVLHIVRPEALGPATVIADRKPIKLIPEIWSAFATPLPPGERRYFDPATRQITSEPEGEGAREIPSNLISDGLLSAGQIADHVRQWVNAQQLDLSLFLVTRVRREPDSATLLHQILETLDREQLRRTQLPLDVIKTLSERRGS